MEVEKESFVKEKGAKHEIFHLLYTFLYDCND